MAKLTIEIPDDILQEYSTLDGEAGSDFLNDRILPLLDEALNTLSDKSSSEEPEEPSECPKELDKAELGTNTESAVTKLKDEVLSDKKQKDIKPKETKKEKVQTEHDGISDEDLQAVQTTLMGCLY